MSAPQIPDGWGLDRVEHLPGRIIRAFGDRTFGAINPRKDGRFTAAVWRDNPTEQLLGGGGAGPTYASYEAAADACYKAVRDKPRVVRMNFQEAFDAWEKDGGLPPRVDIRIEKDDVIQSIINNAPFIEQHRGEQRFVGDYMIVCLRPDGEGV